MPRNTTNKQPWLYIILLFDSYQSALIYVCTWCQKL